MADALDGSHQEQGPPVAPLCSWQGDDVRLAEVLAALDRLRRKGDRLATRTAVVNLVVVAGGDQERERALDAVHVLGNRHPGRTVVLQCPPAGPAEGVPAGRVDATVEIHGVTAEGRVLWFEDVVLRVPPRAVYHLDSLVEPFTLPELPVVVWYVARLPQEGDPLAELADLVLVDSKELGNAACFTALGGLARRYRMSDLSWARLRPWRELLAGLFQGRAYRPFVAGVRRAEVAGKAGPRHLLGGWLVDRLGLHPGSVRLSDDRHAALRLRAEHEGQAAWFVVERRARGGPVGEPGASTDAGRRMVHAAAVVEGGPSHDDLVLLPEDTLSWSVADALSRPGGDPVYDRALRAALTFPG